MKRPAGLVGRPDQLHPYPYAPIHLLSYYVVACFGVSATIDQRVGIAKKLGAYDYILVGLPGTNLGYLNTVPGIPCANIAGQRVVIGIVVICSGNMYPITAIGIADIAANNAIVTLYYMYSVNAILKALVTGHHNPV